MGIDGLDKFIGMVVENVLNAWHERHWLKPQLIEQPELMQVKLEMKIVNAENLTAPQRGRNEGQKEGQLRIQCATSQNARNSFISVLAHDTRFQ